MCRNMSVGFRGRHEIPTFRSRSLQQHTLISASPRRQAVCAPGWVKKLVDSLTGEVKYLVAHTPDGIFGSVIYFFLGQDTFIFMLSE